MENYTPDNKTASELGQLSELLKIDLYDGIKSLVKYTREGGEKSPFKESAYINSGIEQIRKIAEKHLFGFAKNITVEYSLLASTLDPDNPGKLKCCSFSYGEKDFQDKVDRKYVECINQTAETKGLSLYQHRDFLYDLKLDDRLHSKYGPGVEWKNTDDGVRTCVLKNGECLMITIKKGIVKDDYSIEASSPTDEHFRQYDEYLWLKAFVLSRSYEEMLIGAKTFEVGKGQTVEDIQNCLHSFCHRNITNEGARTNNTSIYISFPIFSSRASNTLAKYRISDDAKQGIGACFVFIEPEDEKDFGRNEVVEEIKEGVSDFVSETSAFLRFVAVNYVFNMGLLLQAQAKKETEKSAKAAIMSRNMSHNLGSHVMSYLKQQLGSITAITNDESKVLSNLFPWPEDMSPEMKKYMADKLNQTELPFLVGLGRFIGYLQERQDYIATIATDYIPYGAPVNLKDAIYDELNPDLRYIRHRDQSKNRPTNILLNYIAKSEGLSRERMKKDEKSGILKIDSEGDIRFGFIHYDGEGEARSFGFDTFDSSDPVLGEMRKINFNLPGGLVGRQAIFSIIENLIRNAAKHGDKTNAVNLDFAFDIIDGSQIKEGRCVAWEKRVGDARWRKLYEAAEDIDDLYLVTITDNLPNKKENVDYLQKGLYEGYVDENTGQMLTTNKGVKEMRISAAWLRGNTDESQYKKIKDDTGRCAPLLAVELSPEGHLRNIICVHKNKTVVVVKEVEVEDGTKVAFDEKEINYFKNLQEQSPDCWNVFEDEKDEGGNVMESAVEQIRKSKTSYSFILCPDSEKAFDVLRPITSNRLLRWKKPQADIDSYSSDALLLYVYRLFTNIDERSEDIFIDDYSLLDIKYSKIRKVNSNEGVIAPEHAFLYRTHLGSKKDYMAFVRNNKNDKDHEKEYACAEGITGDNSSDRLIRREPLDERWYYNHLYALKKRIAIIDERIFKMVHNIDENTQLKRDSDEPVAIASLEGKYELDKVKRILIEKGKLSIIQKAKVDKANSFVELSSIVESASISLFEKKELDVEAHGSEYTTPFYKGKNIDVFTVIEGADGDMILVGCIKSTHEIDGDDVKFDNTFGKIATFVRNVSTGNVELIFENESLGGQFGDVYDYISVHQGILDKIYDNLGIKHNNGEKGKVTECIYRRLMRDASAIGDYLPNLIIHSGRAKPSEEDMPQKQPFVQFAAIENAVKDCKPMLVDLLDYAKYETN